MINPCYTVGTAKIEITPPLDIPYLGLFPRHCCFQGVHDPLYARALVIGDGETDIAAIDVDAIGFDNALFGKDRNFTGELRTQISRETGILPHNILLAAPHIHSTPDTLNFRPLAESPGAEAWLESLIVKISAAVAMAKCSRFKASMKAGRGSVAGISVNRRGGDCLDTEMIVILFQALESDDYAMLVHYACHPVIVQVQDQVSGDYVGALQAACEKAVNQPGACLFLQGACGDINPKVNDSRSFDDVHKTGLALAGEAIKLYGQMGFQDYSRQPVLIRTGFRQIKLPSSPLPPPEERLAIEQALKAYQGRGCRGKQEQDRFSWLEDMSHRFKQDSDFFDAEVQVFRIGDCLLAAVSGELLCETGLAVKQMASPLTGMLVGYANGYVGYIASPAAWARGGYEVSPGPWCKVGPDGYETVENSLADLIREMKAE